MSAQLPNAADEANSLESQANPPSPSASFDFVGMLYRLLRGQADDGTTTSRGEAAVRATLAGGISGGAVVLASWAITWLTTRLIPDFSLAGPVWDLLLRPEWMAVGCIAVLLLFFQGEANHRAGLLAGASVAGLIPVATEPLLIALGQQPLPQPLYLGLAAAVLCAILVSPGSRSIRIAHVRAASIQSASDGMLVVDQQGHLLDANPAARTALNLPSAPRWPKGPSMAPRAIQGILRDPGHRRERLKSASGRFFEAWTTPLEPTGPLRTMRGVLIRDVTTRHINEKKLVRLAHYDSLTGLANRRLFLEMLVQALDAARPRQSSVALFYIDLDHFKGINDTLGHATGDAMLQTLAERFRKHLRSEDLAQFRREGSGRICIARLAGDEFAVVVPGVSDPQATNDLGTHILSLISKPMNLPDRTLTSSGSVGVAVFPEDGEDAETLIRHADAALYVAKNRGRRRVAHFEANFEAKADRERLIEEGLRNAIARGELALHYQPKIDLPSGTVAGYEALLRWTSADLGSIGPADFIPIAEERGLICELGSWCLDQTCLQLRIWKDAGFANVPISVNVSSVQFTETDLQRVVSDALRKHEVDPQLLELELTESILLEEGDATESTLRDLRAIGIGIALDDFGTGYSALTYLNRFPLDVLKMDRALVRDIDANGSSEGVAGAVVAMAHTLGLTVVAEGIDLETQLEPLRRMKCDQVQGFLYAQALPADEASQFLARQGHRPPIARMASERLELKIEGGGAVPDDDLEADMLPSLKSAAPVTTPAPRSDVVTDATQKMETDMVTVISRAEAGGRLLVVDDESGSLGPVALRLGRLGVDLHYTAEADEAHLFIRQEKDVIRLLATTPKFDLEAAGRILDDLGREIGSRPPFVVIGEEPDEERRTAIREAGANWVLWAPFDDAELRFLVKRAMALPTELSERKDVRFPINLMANLRTGGRREVAVISSLSQRGAFIEMTESLAVGAQLQIEFDLGDKPIRGFARVIYQQREDPEFLSRPPGIGVVFFGLDREAERLLREVAMEREARYLP
ncbi:MAG: EAL domain-containing protein [Deltaproteobacteria bacterium]|nr:EAL domain-containing protein [Deltaproteobacteria bacterium]